MEEATRLAPSCGRTRHMPASDSVPTLHSWVELTTWLLLVLPDLLLQVLNQMTQMTV